MTRHGKRFEAGSASLDCGQGLAYLAGMNVPLRNPWQPPLPVPVSPADVERVRVEGVLTEARFAFRKLEFAKLLFERPTEPPLRLIQMLFPDPADTANCLTLATLWPTDPDVIRHMDTLRRPGNTPLDALPDKDGLAMRLIQIADNAHSSPADKLKALAQYQTLMGMDPPKSANPGFGNGVNVNVNLTTERRVFVLPKMVSPEEWEAENDPANQKTIELTANAPTG